MKKFLAMILCLVMVLSLAACGAAEEPAQEPAEEPAGDAAGEETPVEESDVDWPKRNITLLCGLSARRLQRPGRPCPGRQPGQGAGRGRDGGERHRRRKLDRLEPAPPQHRPRWGHLRVY